MPTVPFRQDRRTPRRYNYLFPRPRSVQHLMTRSHRRSWNRSQAAVHRRDWDGPPARRLRVLRPPDPPCRRERRGAGQCNCPRRPPGHRLAMEALMAGHLRCDPWTTGSRNHPTRRRTAGPTQHHVEHPGKVISGDTTPLTNDTRTKTTIRPKRVTHRWIQAKRDTGIGNSRQANSWSTLGDLDAFCRRARARRGAVSRRSQPHCHRRP